MGSVPGALAALDWLESRHPRIVVPGHGPVLAGAEVERVFAEHRRYYRLVLHAAEEGIEGAEVVRNTSTKRVFASWRRRSGRITGTAGALPVDRYTGSCTSMPPLGRGPGHHRRW